MIIQTQRGGRISSENSCNVISQFIVRTIEVGSSSTYYTALRVAKPPILEQQLINTEYTIGTIPFINGYTVTQITVQQGGIYTTKYKQGSTNTLDTPILIDDHTTISYYCKPNKTLYLFDKDNGGDMTEITGGWEINKLNYTQPNTKGSASVTKEQLTVSASGYTQANIRTKNKIDFSKYSKLYIHFKEITFAYGASNNGIGLEAFGVATSETQNVANTALKTSTLNVSRPSGLYGDTYKDKTGSCSISNLQSNNGYLYFIVVRPNQDAAKTPKMIIDKIWLE